MGASGIVRRVRLLVLSIRTASCKEDNVKLFDDIQFKDVKSTVYLGLKNSKKKELSTWEISRYIFDLNTYYYKYEVINSIALALSNGVKPEDIIVINESFMLNHQYARLNVIDLERPELNLLYFLGLPYSMVPSVAIFNMRIIFQYYRMINEFLFHSELKRNETKIIYLFYLESLSGGLDTAIQAITQLSEKKIANSKKHVELSNLLVKLSKNFQKQYKKEFAQLEKDLVLDIKTLQEKKNTIKSYTFFFSILDKLQRPVVLVIDQQANKARILCRTQLNKKAKDKTTFTLRSVIQNSPIQMLVQSGISILTAIKDEERKQELHAIELELKNAEAKKAKTDAEISRIKLLTAQIELMEQIAHFEQNPNYTHISRITTPYLKQQLSFANDRITENLKTLNNRVGMEIDYQTTKIDIQI